MAENNVATNEQFIYEIESGRIKDEGCCYIDAGCKELAPYSGKGIRIKLCRWVKNGRVVVPEEIDGMPVVSIGPKAFYNCRIQEVVLPKTMKALLSEAFYRCEKLERIMIPEGVAYMGSRCFAQSGIREAILPDTLRTVPSGGFWGCRRLRQVRLGNQVEKISAYAFADCLQLNSLLLPESIRELGTHSLSGNRITELTIPEGAQIVSSEIFGYDLKKKFRRVTCFFLGAETEVIGNRLGLCEVELLYCHPGSAVWKIACDKRIPVKPLES